MAASEDEEKFQALMVAVQRHFDREEFEKGLSKCGKALELRPDDDVVRRCKVFALLSLSKWSEALQVSEKFASKQEGFHFERAYCLYRLNRFQDSLTALSEANKEDDVDGRFGRLEAQVRYRMGDYEACAGMYSKIQQEDPDDINALANVLATLISGDKPHEAIRLVEEKESQLETSYELCFNLACALIDAGRLDEAAQRLQRAKEICVAELIEAEELPEEDAAKVEDHEELAAINVQQGYVAQRLGDFELAHNQYSRVLKLRNLNREVDVTVLAVACNNVNAIKTEGKTMLDSLKRINIASKENLEHKLTKRQMLEISINKCLLLLQTRKSEEAKRELQRLKTLFPGHPRCAIVQAAMSYRQTQHKACEEVLQAYLAEHPGNEEVLLSLVAFHAKHNRHEKAVEAFSQLPLRSRVKPECVEAIASMHLRIKSAEKAVACLREAIDFWSGKTGDADEQTLAAVLRLAARLAPQLKNKEFAPEVYQLFLEKIDGDDNEAVCGLVRSLASTDTERAELYAQRLHLPDYGHLDPEELEKSGIPRMTALRKKDVGEAKEEEKKKKKKKKIRYPKGVDPENPGPAPDPEAQRQKWLPKTQRADYVKIMKKRDKKLERSTQGGGAPLDDNAFRKQGPSTAQVEVSRDSSKPSRNQGRRKKNK